MKLNLNCVRDVLMYIEENTEFQQLWHVYPMTLEEVENSLSEKYTRQEIWYALFVLKDSRYIRARIMEPDSEYRAYDNSGQKIYCLTTRGISLLNCIKSQKIWDIVKFYYDKNDFITLDNLRSISERIINLYISQTLDKTIFEYQEKFGLNQNTVKEE